MCSCTTALLLSSLPDSRDWIRICSLERIKPPDSESLPNGTSRSVGSNWRCSGPASGRRRLWTRGKPSPLQQVRVIWPCAGLTAVERAIAIYRTSRSPMRSSESFTAMRESLRCRGRARSRRTNLRYRASYAERFSIETVYDRQVTGNTTWRRRRWKPGRGAIRAIPHLTDCWPASPRGAPAETSSRSPEPRGQWLLIRKEALDFHTTEGVRRTLLESSGRGRSHHPSSGRVHKLASHHLLVRYSTPSLARRCRRHESAGGDGQSQSLHRRLDVASRSVAPGGSATIHNVRWTSAIAAAPLRRSSSEGSSGPRCLKGNGRCGSVTGIRQSDTTG